MFIKGHLKGRGEKFEVDEDQLIEVLKDRVFTPGRKISIKSLNSFELRSIEISTLNLHN